MGGPGRKEFLTGAAVLKGARCSTPALKWLTDQPVWIPQWPLEEEKLNALKTLVKEQLAQGHIEPSMSPWNTPLFVVKKKAGIWRLLHDLRRINSVMEGMGAEAK